MLALLLCASMAFAQEPQPDAQYVNLKQGEPAPFDGRLLNAEALAILIVDNQTALKECDIQIEYQKSILRAEKDYQIDVLKATCDAQRQKYEDLLAIREDQVQSLEKLVKPRSVWRDVGSFILGSAITVGIVYAVTPAFDNQ